jgi:hypothetical protein
MLMFTSSVPSSQKTHWISITNKNYTLLSKEIKDCDNVIQEQMILVLRSSRTSKYVTCNYNFALKREQLSEVKLFTFRSPKRSQRY